MTGDGRAQISVAAVEIPIFARKVEEATKKRELSKKGIILWSASNERIGTTAQQFQIRIPELHNELNF